jgi:hypothetical protein
MTELVLLSRDIFRTLIFARDIHKCVICNAAAKDAHHIIERRLWPDGGYYLDNGASLCGDCHLSAERTTLSVEDIRRAARIVRVVVPPHLYRDQSYDKWGNPCFPNGTRARGELFQDASVQKVLGEGGVLQLFTDRVKYPRTYHLPYSPGVTDDDRVGDDVDLAGKEVVVTLKMDGENTTLYHDGLHARSLTFEGHPSRNRVRALHASVAQDIPAGWRVCGENVTAVHSIKYDNLPGHFLTFSVWNDANLCLSWDETVEWSALLGLPHVDVLWRGTYDAFAIRNAFSSRASLGPSFDREHEGFVVRTTGPFHFSTFRHNVMKFVRANHVQTHGHWMRSKMEFNGLGS